MTNDTDLEKWEREQRYRYMTREEFNSTMRIQNLVLYALMYDVSEKEEK